MKKGLIKGILIGACGVGLTLLGAKKVLQKDCDADEAIEGEYTEEENFEEVSNDED